MKRRIALGAVLGAALIALGGCSATGSSADTVSISGTLSAQNLGGITVDPPPTVELKQASNTKYTLSLSYAYDAEMQTLSGTLPPTSIVPGTYDVVITIDSVGSPIDYSCYCTVNDTPVGGTVVVAGSTPPYVVTIPAVPIQASATVHLVVDAVGL